MGIPLTPDHLAKMAEGRRRAHADRVAKKQQALAEAAIHANVTLTQPERQTSIGVLEPQVEVITKNALPTAVVSSACTIEVVRCTCGRVMRRTARKPNQVDQKTWRFQFECDCRSMVSINVTQTRVG